jgi:hypothetical protein
MEGERLDFGTELPAHLGKYFSREASVRRGRLGLVISDTHVSSLSYLYPSATMLRLQKFTIDVRISIIEITILPLSSNQGRSAIAVVDGSVRLLCDSVKK